MSLLTTLQVKEIALRWGGTTRVYRNDGLKVFSVDDKETFKFSNGTYGESVQGIYLEYEVTSATFELLSPSGVTSHGIVAALNALNDPAVNVVFFPIYDVDSNVSYQVIRAGGEYQMLNTQRQMFSRSVSFRLLNETRLDDIPDWLEITADST